MYDKTLNTAHDRHVIHNMLTGVVHGMKGMFVLFMPCMQKRDIHNRHAQQGRRLPSQTTYTEVWQAAKYCRRGMYRRRRHALPAVSMGDSESFPQPSFSFSRCVHAVRCKQTGRCL